MPTTWNGRPLRFRVRPRSALPPCRRASSFDTTTTGSAPARSSSGVSSRPAAAGTEKVARRSPLTRAAGICTAVSPSRTSAGQAAKAPIASKPATCAAEVLHVRVRLLGAEGDQRGGTRVGERPEEHPVHEREQGDARADPHRERRHDEGAERPRVTKRAKRRSQVLEESAHVGPASSIHASEVPGTRRLCPVECGNARPTLGRHRPTACRPCPLRP